MADDSKPAPAGMTWKDAGAPRRAPATSPLDKVDRFNEISAQTLREAWDSDLPGPRNGPQDAYRHALWTGRMTREFGPVVARGAGLANEAVGIAKNLYHRGTPELEESAMDLKNNERGIIAALESRDEQEMASRLRGMADHTREPKTYSEAWKALFADELVNFPPNQPDEGGGK